MIVLILQMLGSNRWVSLFPGYDNEPQSDPVPVGNPEASPGEQDNPG